MNMLYDFYGQLLTDRQKSFMELYYGQNLSLGEIAEEFAVSRQAVYDTLKRAEQVLSQYEEKLGLVAKFNSEKSKLAAVVSLLDEHVAAAGDSGKIQKARDILREMIDLPK